MFRFLITGQGLLAFLATGLAAVFVLTNNIHGKVNKYFVALSFCIGLWCLGPFLANMISNYHVSLMVQRAAYFFGIIMFPIFLEFVTAIGEVQIKKYIRYLYYGITIVFLCFLPTPLFIKGLVSVKGTTLLQTSPGIIYHIFPITFAIGYAGSLYFVYLGMKKSIGARKNQIKFVLISYVVCYVGGGFYFSTIYRVFNIFTQAGYIIGLSILILFYSIIKHQLMDVRIAVARSTVFGIVYSFVLGIPFLLVTGYKSFLVRVFGENWDIFSIVVTIILASTGPIIYNYLRRKAEGRILKEQRAYHNSLLKASKEMIFVREITDIGDRLVEILTKEIKISHVRLFYYNEKKKVYRVISFKGIERRVQTDAVLNDKHPLIKLFNKDKRTIVCDDFSRSDYRVKYNLNIDLLRNETRSLGASLIVPNFSRNKLRGFISLGAKENKEMYTTDDIAVLTTLGNQVALAMENAEFYQKLREQEATLLQTSKLSSLGEMAAGFAHQINNPLAGIILTAGTYRMKIEQQMPQCIEELNSKSSDSVKQLIDGSMETFKAIENRAEHAGKIVNSIMRFTKPDELQEANIVDVVEDGLSLIPENKFKKCNVELEKEIENNIPTVKIRPIDIEQVIMNLCNNALDAMSKGGKLIVRASKDKNSDNVKIEVADTGVGISKKNIDKIFDFFFTTKGSQGLGLGLALVYKMVTSSNGQISVKSKIGSGTIFTVLLPIYKKDENVESAEKKTPEIAKV